MSILVALDTKAENKPKTITLTKQNLIHFKGDVTARSMAYITEWAHALDHHRGRQTYPLYLLIDSRGGSPEAVQKFVEDTKEIKNLHTISVFSASAAAFLVQLNPGRRYVLENGRLMFHRVRLGMNNFYLIEDIWRILLRELGYDEALEASIAARLGITQKQYRQRLILSPLRRKDWWIRGAANISSNTADEVVKIKCDKELTDTIVGEMTLVDDEVVITRRSACPVL